MGKENKIGIIISREYSSRVKKKSFILLTLLTPLLFAAMIVIPTLIAISTAEHKDNMNIAVVDKSGVVMPYLDSIENTTFEAVNPAILPQLKKDIATSGKYSALLVIDSLDKENNAAASIYSSGQVGMSTQSDIENKIDKALQDNKLRSYNIPNLDKVIDNFQTDVKIKTYQVGEQGEDKETHVEANMALGYIASFIIYMFIFMFGGMVMRGVIEEKNNRIIEVIVSSVKPVQLMIGKIVGVALVALTQFFIWILLTGIIVAVVMGVAGADTVTNAMQSQAAVQQATSAAAQAGESMPSISSIFGMLGGMHIGGVLISFLIYFVLGYLLYSSMFAAVGSCVDNEADTQQLMLPITIPLIIGLFIMLSAFQSPNSSIAVWGSIIPFTSPMVMMARVSYGIGFAAGVPIWQYVLSIVLLVATFLVMAWLSGKIYRIGILSYGKKAGWKEIGKWLKFKD